MADSCHLKIGELPYKGLTNFNKVWHCYVG